MNVLVIGGGGREHALVWKLAQSPDADQVFCAPGNAGMDSAQRIDISDIADLARFAEENAVGLTVVGPEAPLCDGIVNVFRERGLTIMGPDQTAAQLEGSKSYAKEFMAKYDIPTAAYETFTDAQAAKSYLRQVGAPVVVKADGLAAGKGVTVAMAETDAEQAIDECFSGRFGDAGAKVVIEECLMGEEASILALTDGKTIVPLVSSQDHKRVGEGDTGPNTGGMGAYSPAPVVTETLWETIRTEVLARFLSGIQQEGLDFRGVIYAGVMVTESGPKVLEFNVRFGDPETQPILMRLDSDLLAALKATAEGALADATLTWSDDTAVCVVLASEGYPGAYAKGRTITGIDAAENTGAVVFHAGTKREQDQLLTAGGRVLGVTARGATIQEAVANVYRAVDCIHWQGANCRRDIAYRALDR